MIRLFCFLLYFSALCRCGINHRLSFVKDFVDNQNKPSFVISLMDTTRHNNFKAIKSTNLTFIANSNVTDIVLKCNKIRSLGNVVYLADLNREHTVDILFQAETANLLDSPSRWLLFYRPRENSTTKYDPEQRLSADIKLEIGLLLQNFSIAINTEVYLVIDSNGEREYQVWMVYKIKPHLPLVWERCGAGVAGGVGVAGVPRDVGGVGGAGPCAGVAMRRRDVRGQRVVSCGVILDRASLQHMKDYKHRDVDTLTKLLGHMTEHLFEWVNGEGHMNICSTWGYRKPDGSFDGIIKELWDGRSDFSSSVLIQSLDRMPAVRYVLPPAPVDVRFIFRKPSLASVTNIYSLPFSAGVWASVAGLIVVSSAALFMTSRRETDMKHCSWWQRLSQGVHDTLCLVFQQGTPVDPLAISSRQVLFLGLLVFMFLYTAYSANVVALLQSASDEINTVQALLTSPLQCGAQDVPYNREIFQRETRPVHRALWLKKGLPQGENFFLSVKEGIRKMREGMFAFQVEPTAGYDELKRTFHEHEKCHLGSVKYTEFLYPSVGVARRAPLREALGLGVLRTIESGVQSRSTRRILSVKPQCGAGTATFTAVSLTDVAPAFQLMLMVYGIAAILFVVELVVYRKWDGYR